MFANMKIRYKLLLLMLLPLSGFSVYSGYECLDRYQAWRDMDRLTEAVDVMVDLGAMAHELQKERGLSSGFVASKGQSFSTEMASQRGRTDQAAKALRDRLGTARAVSSHDGFALSLRSIDKTLDGLRELRSGVDSLGRQPREIIADYTAAVARILEGCSSVLALAGGSGTTRAAAAYLALLEGKEIAGQERAVLNGAFAAGTFTRELYRDWQSAVGAQGADLKSFETLGDQPAETLLRDKVAGPDREVASFRDLAFRNQDQPSLGGDAKAWYAAATARIDALKQVEDAWSAQLKEHAGRVLDLARREFFLTIAWAVGLIGISALLGRMIFQSISAPLLRAVGFARGVASGDLDQTLAEDRTDEIGILCAALAAMLAKLKELIAQAEAAMAEAGREAVLAREAAQLAEQAKAQAQAATSEGMHLAAGRLEGVVQAMTRASEDLAAEVEQSSRGATLQSERVGETAMAMGEMNKTVLEVARNASAASDTADKARQEAKTGSEVVREAVSGIGQARDDSLELKRHMGDLGSRAKDIGRIMGVISDIADQTNLLALNAAIEAARAGDAGRGFAVVADEVRKLAEKTMDATREVAESIQGIQAGAATTISNVDRAVALIEAATQQAEKSGQALESIVSFVDQASHQISSIAAVSEDQTAASEEINRYLDEVNTISTETAQTMGKSSQAVAELAQQARSLNDLVEELRGA